MGQPGAGLVTTSVMPYRDDATTYEEPEVNLGSFGLTTLRDAGNSAELLEDASTIALVQGEVRKKPKLQPSENKKTMGHKAQGVCGVDRKSSSEDLGGGEHRIAALPTPLLGVPWTARHVPCLLRRL